MAPFIFFRIVNSAMSLEKKQKIRKIGSQFVGWYMINIVYENHTQIRKIKRGMSHLPLWQ